MEGALSPTQVQQVTAMIAESMTTSTQFVNLDEIIIGLCTELDDVKLVSERLLNQTHGVLVSIQGEATSLRADMASAQTGNQAQIEAMRVHQLQTQSGLKELNVLGSRLREVATINDTTVAQARLDIDRVRTDTLAVMGAELANLKEQAVTDKCNLNLLYAETRQGLQEIEARVNAAAGTNE